MIFEFSRVMRAVSISLMGVALFLSACQAPRVVEKVPKPPDETARSLFLRAETAHQTGLYEEALQGYALYLQKHPGGKDAGSALYQIARLRYGGAQYEEALGLFLRMVREYPNHPKVPSAQYYIVALHHRLEHHEQSKVVALEWLMKYPDHALKANIYDLLGKNARALGEDARALIWWIEADAVLRDKGIEQDDMVERIIGLIQTTHPDVLREIAEHAAKSPYAPFVYHRLASGYFDDHDLENAREMAMALIRSTPEQSWVSIGREILDRITQELSVKPGVIGCLLPLSGPFSIYGQEVLNGIQLGMGLFDELEDMGIELIIKDTAGHEEEAVSHVDALVEKNQVMAIIGPLASKTSRAAAQRAQQRGVPIITLTQMDGITSIGDMVFRNFLTPTNEVKILTEKAVNEMGMTRFGILYPDNTYGRFMMNRFWDMLEVLGGMVTAVESYDPAETDFASQIKKMVGLYYPRPESVKQMLREMKAMSMEGKAEEEEENKEEKDEEEEPEPIVDFDAVFVPDYYQHVALIAPQFPFHNVFKVRLLGTNLWQSPELIAQAGEYLQGAVFSTGFFVEGPSAQIRDFVASYRDSFDAEPGILAATGYDTINFLKTLIKSGDLRSRKDFRDGLLSAGGYGGLTGEIAFDDRGEVMKRPTLLTISGRSLDIVP